MIWFASNNSAEYEKDLDYDFIDILKTNNKGFCKEKPRT